KPEEVARLKDQLVNFISSASGGPRTYDGKSMKDLHAGMKITDKEFDALAGDLRKALEMNKVKPEDAAELLNAVETTRRSIVEKRPEGRPEAENPADKGDVTGKVVVKGKPLAEGTIAFVPEKGDAASGKIAADGTYKVSNVPAGRYTVVI